MARDATELARRWRMDVNTGTEGAPVWVQVMGILEFTPPKIDPTVQKSTDYEDGGWAGNQVTGLEWTVEASVRRKRSLVGSYDPGQEFIRGKKFLMGAARNVQVRVYERAGGAGTEAYMGTGFPKFEDDKGKQDDLASASITITGDGSLVEIANPAG